jgi:hypothetical protein
MTQYNELIDNWNRCIALLRDAQRNAKKKWLHEEQWAQEVMTEFQTPLVLHYRNYESAAQALVRNFKLFHKQLPDETKLFSSTYKNALDKLIHQSVSLQNSSTHHIDDDAYICLQLEKMKCEITFVWWKMKYQYQIHLLIRKERKDDELKAKSQNPPLFLKHTWPKHHQVKQCNIYVPLALRDEAKADDENMYQSSSWHIPKYTCRSDFQSFEFQIEYLKKNIAKYIIAFKTHHTDIRRMCEDVFDSYMENRPFINGFPLTVDDISDEFDELLNGQHATHVLHKYRSNICENCAKLINR